MMSMMVNRVFTLLLLIILLSHSAPANAENAGYEIDQSNIEWNLSGLRISTDPLNPSWQTFTVGNVNNICRIDIFAYSTLVHAISFAFGMYNDTTQNFETPLHTDKIVQEAASFENTYFAIFEFNPIPVTPNSQYYFQFYTETSSGSLETYYSDQNPYSSGRSDQSANADYMFVTYYTVGEPNSNSVTTTETLYEATQTINQTQTIFSTTTERTTINQTTTINNTVTSNTPVNSFFALIALGVILLIRRRKK